MTAPTLTLILIRHGNTFDPGDTVLRVGKRTDLPLSSSGRAQAEKLGAHLTSEHLRPDLVFTSELKRTQETASLALNAAGYTAPLQSLPILNEIDYGIDDGKPESDVVARLGEDALRQWDNLAMMPLEWSPQPRHIIQSLSDFLSIIAAHQGRCVWAVTSNGIARFIPQLCENSGPVDIKLRTGAFAHLEYRGETWHLKGWNIRPE